jgi:hypothetical protein
VSYKPNPKETDEQQMKNIKHQELFVKRLEFSLGIMEASGNGSLSLGIHDFRSSDIHVFAI